MDDVEEVFMPDTARALPFPAIAIAVIFSIGADIPVAAAQQAPDTASIWTIQGENASISTAKLTDRFYTNGLRLGWTSGEGVLPGFLEQAGRRLWGDGTQRISIDISQQIYNPADTASRIPATGDRPYAGVLMANASLTQDTATSRSVLSLGLGVLGPSALGQDVQNGFHDLIGQNHVYGWNTQLRDEPVVQATLGRTWRMPVAGFGGLEVDALPNVTVGIGTLRIYAQTGVTLRIGQGLDSDFGAPRVSPGLSGGDAYTAHRPFAWYVFAGVDGQAVAHDVLLDGNNWQDSRSVSKHAFVAEAQGGVAIMAYGARLTYTHVLQTQEFRGQRGGLHQFGSLALSVKF
jgi:lipid A 3-O-deacylase